AETVTLAATIRAPLASETVPTMAPSGLCGRRTLPHAKMKSRTPAITFIFCLCSVQIFAVYHQSDHCREPDCQLPGAGTSSFSESFRRSSHNVQHSSAPISVLGLCSYYPR